MKQVRKRKAHLPEFKAKVGLEALRGEKTVYQIGGEASGKAAGKATREAVSVARQCVLAGVSCATVYAQRRPKPAEPSELLHKKLNKAHRPKGRGINRALEPDCLRPKGRGIEPEEIQSSFTPAFFTSRAYFSNSLLKNSPAASGVDSRIVLPCLAITSCTSGAAKAAVNAALRRLT